LVFSWLFSIGLSAEYVGKTLDSNIPATVQRLFLTNLKKKIASHL